MSVARIFSFLGPSEENVDYYQKNRQYLREEYGGETVAILEGNTVEIVDSSWPEIEGEMDKLQEIYGRKTASDAYVVDVPSQ